MVKESNVTLSLSKGMKQTEIGLISNDWVFETFGDCLEGFSSGMTPYRGNKEYYRGDFPWITSGELNYNVITNTIEKITPLAIKNTNLKVIPKGTFLMAITGLEAEGTRGSCAITGIKATTNQSCMALYPQKSKITTSFLYHYYVAFGNELALKYCQGTKQQSYNAVTAKKLPICYPKSLAEQEAISEALSDADAWIESLEQLITKKRLIKQGVMQELLTPKEDWEVKKLGETGVFFSTNSLSRDDLNYLDGQIYNIHYGDIHTRFKSHFNLENEFVPFINEASIGNKKFNRCQVGDLIIADASENETDIGKAIEISTLNEKLVVSGLHTIHYRPNLQTFSLDYLGHLWQSKFIKEQILKEAQGTKVLGISVSRLRDLNIPIVSLTEQTRIVTILSDMDAELEALAKQLEKARKIKQGMMQELLTGRVRLV